jgi:dUTP pyrophosphatase
MINIKIVNTSPNSLPKYETIDSSGMDLRAHLSSPITLKPLERMLIPTGLFIELPAGFEAQVRPRSGLAIKYGITVLNSPGTIDADYRGEVKIILVNLSQDNFEINNGDRIAQIIVAQHEKVEWVPVEALSGTERGSGGFNSTGKK